MSDNEQTPENVEDNSPASPSSQDNPTDSQSEAQTESADTVEGLQAQLAESQAKAEENWEQVLRARAEMDNLRRRNERELENAHKFALERFSQELLPVMDSLEMGLAAVGADDSQLDKLKEGTELTLKMFNSVMEKFGILEVHPLDEPFNPELHQAMSMLESPDHAPNTVMNVMQKGYVLNERLIRPAMVVVSKAPTGGTDAGDPDSDKPGSTKIDEQA